MGQSVCRNSACIDGRGGEASPHSRSEPLPSGRGRSDGGGTNSGRPLLFHKKGVSKRRKACLQGGPRSVASDRFAAQRLTPARQHTRPALDSWCRMPAPLSARRTPRIHSTASQVYAMGRGSFVARDIGGGTARTAGDCRGIARRLQRPSGRTAGVCFGNAGRNRPRALQIKANGKLSDSQRRGTIPD